MLGRRGGALAFVSSKMNSKDYVRVLDDNVQPFFEARRGQQLVYQHDNALIHASAETKRFLRDKNINVFDWPACSPDLNPMENIWGHIVRQIYVGNRQYASVNELKVAISEAWRELTLARLQNHVESMPDRIYEVIRSGGRAINY